MVDISKAQVIASTIGFEQPHWNTQYYPEECPEDWRFAYFMNDFRAVYLPADAWYNKPQQIQQYIQEIDVNFDLVLEWPVTNIKSCESYLSQLQPLKNNIASFVLDAERVARSALVATIETIGNHYPVALNCKDPENQQLYALAKQYKTSVVWNPERSDTPISHNGYQIVRVACQELRKLKTTLSILQKESSKDTRSGLFFEPGLQSTQCAMQTRELIELLEMA